MSKHEQIDLRRIAFYHSFLPLDKRPYARRCLEFTPQKAVFPRSGRGSRHEDRSQEGTCCNKGVSFSNGTIEYDIHRKTLGSTASISDDRGRMKCEVFLSADG